MAITRQGGPGIPLDTKPLLGNNNVLTLAAGEAWTVPAGQYYVSPGPYSFIQLLDPITGTWRAIDRGVGAQFITSDGANVRLANLSGCAVGALITNVGSGYTGTPTVTASAGGSQWRAIVGGAVDSTVTVVDGGSGYNYVPQLVFSAPPPGGVQATGYVTIAAGSVTAVVVTNQGAGYLTPPTAHVVPDPRDTTGQIVPPQLTVALTGAGTVTAVLCTDPGAPLTSVPTLTISGGGGSAAAATAVMAFAATGFTVGAGGVAYGNAQPFLVQAVGGTVGGTPGAVVNPQLNVDLFTPRAGVIVGESTAGGAVQATGAVIHDGGLFQSVPIGIVTAGGSGLPTTTAQVTITVGGVADTSIVQPF